MVFRRIAVWPLPSILHKLYWDWYDSMNVSGAKENGSAAKIAYLGLFALSLVLARGIVVLRSAVVLGEPIALKHAGLSLRLPDGNGWQCERRWAYGDNSFILKSLLRSRGSEARGIVRCRYFIAARSERTQALLTYRAASARGKTIRTGRIGSAGTSFDWAHIASRSGRTNIYYGIALLAGNRQLDIEVLDYTAKPEAARRVFERVVGTVELEEDSVLGAGARVVERMRKKGLSSYFRSKRRHRFSLIKDARQQPLGFTADVSSVETQEGDSSRIRLVSLLYSRGLSVREHVASLSTDERFEQFTLKSQTVGAEPSGAEIVVDRSGVMKITRLGQTRSEDSYLFSTAMVPAMLLEQLLQEFIESRRKEIVVDVIETDGGITPTYISMTDANGPGRRDDGSYRLQLLPLGGAETVELVYLDENMEVFRSLLRGKQIYVFETAEPEEVSLLFPERAELIHDRNKLEQYLD